MKHLAGAVRVGFLVIAVSVLGYVTWKSVSERASGAKGYKLWGHFRDASGLADKSRVVIAGLIVGEISDRRLDGRWAKVTVRVRKGTRIWSNAAFYKKSSSLLGEHYLEIDPGTPDAIDARGNRMRNRLLEDGNEVRRVVESTSPADLMRMASETMPKIDAVLVEIRGLAADTRTLLNGPIGSTAATLDKAITQDAALVHGILVRADEISANIRKITGRADMRVDDILDNVDESSRQIKALLGSAQGEVTQAGDAVRAKLDRLDGALDALEAAMGSTASIGQKIDGDQGTLGRLVNDPDIADNLEAITADTRGFTRSLFGLKTIVGLRSEYNFFAQAGRSYFSVELHTQPDRYYLIEAVMDSRGRLDPTYIFDDASGSLERTTIVENDLRLTIQYAKRISFLTLRMGIKESTGGVGADASFFDDRLRFTADLFDFGFDAMPRLRLAAAYHFFKYLYILGGVDDVMNEFASVDVVGGDLTGGRRDTYAFGRDVFGGAMIRFTDEDLKTLLFVGGGALSGLSK